jgi:hypothetical protein
MGKVGRWLGRAYFALHQVDVPTPPIVHFRWPPQVITSGGHPHDALTTKHYSHITSNLFFLSHPKHKHQHVISQYRVQCMHTTQLVPTMFRTSRAIPFRAQIPLRRPVRSPLRAQSRGIHVRGSNAPQRVQPVRMRNPWFSWKKTITWAVYISLSYAGWKYINQFIDIHIEEIEVEDDTATRKQGEWETQEGDSEEDEFAEEDNTFIPMTWATQLPRTFYKGSDPEWQEFVKIAKDKTRHKQLQNELVQVIFSGAKQHPKVAMSIGNDLKVGKYWLEISFPDGPPQEYVRSGIEIGDDFIAWSPQKITAENQYRLTRALWPKATFDGFYATAQMYTGIQYRRLKQALGLEEVNSFSPEERFKVALEMLEKEKQNSGKGRGGSPVGGNPQTSPDGSPGSLVSVSSAANEAQSSPRAAEDRSALPWVLSLPLPASTDLINPTDVQIAKHVFISSLMKNWNPKKLEPPRGSFVVQGLVEIRGSKGRIMFDVQSCYDPKEAKFVTVNAGMRSLKRWNQSPRGGP